MKIQYLITFLILGMFAQQGWAPPPGKGGATGGAEAAPDISKCDLNPTQQTKVMAKGKDGKDHFICIGKAICGGKSVSVKCKASEKELCPMAKACAPLDPGVLKEYWAANCKVIQFRTKDGYHFSKKEIEGCKLLKGYTTYPETTLTNIPIYVIDGSFLYYKVGENEPYIDPTNPRDPNRINHRRNFTIELRRERQSNNYNLDLSVGDMLEGGTALYVPIIVNEGNGLKIETIPADRAKELTIQLSLGQKIRHREEKFNLYEIQPRASGDPLNIDVFIQKSR